ncbi:MAG: putative anti-sigma-factor [Candidatus Desulfovibrio kirbyi]|uniref:Putative anti-sigma-factor n=1 Tax=Candidatus Desulfovibrio kirbyi TaxID=2696086 RepID=A0A6L2R6M6_9BACT|nr:MAG: putative anti-sigma-factor [Candidatus Desulfovibrio kirbyi]
MDAKTLIDTNKDEILRQWIEAVYSLYPLETTGFVRTSSDPFGNPVGDMTKQAAAAIYNAITGEDTAVDTVKAALDRFVKLRAAQRANPSQGLGVFYLMKPILRKLLLPQLAKDDLETYLGVESRLDSLTLLAFDMYASARETLADLRITEIRNQHAQLTRWAQKHGVISTSQAR